MLSALLVAACLLGLAAAQGLTSCDDLDVGNADSPFSGASLSVCQTPSVQCCTQEYLDEIKSELGEDLMEGLKDQLDTREDDLEDILDGLFDYFEGSFLEDFQENIPGATFISDSVDDITSQLEDLLNRANFVISSSNPDFDPVTIFRGIIDRIEDTLRRIPLPSDSQKECLVDQLNAHIQESGILSLGRSLEQIRKSISGLSRIVAFLDRFESTLGGFVVENFPTSCVNRFVELSFCGRCTGRIPPMCGNTCGALVQACFAGFYSDLGAEFEKLWNVVGQLVNTVQREVTSLFQAENDLLDVNILEIARECEITFLGRKRRQTVDEDLVPTEILTRADALFGVFAYGVLGPEFCALDSDEVEFCEGDQTDDDDRSCDDDEVCTSTCQCWDGTAMRATDTDKFNGVSIDDQAENPVLPLSKEDYTVVAPSDTRSSVVTDFLTSEEFVEVMPEGITIPSGSDDGSVPLMVSMVTILGTVIFALLV